MLIVGGLMLLTLGLIYGWSILAKYLKVSDAFSPVAGKLSLVFTVCMIFFCLGGLLGGFLSAKTSVRTALIMAAVLLFGGFFLASRAESIALLCVAYGGLVGTGVGIGYNVIIGAVVPWFPGKAGLISGVLLMGFGTGAFLLGAVAEALIQARGWQQAFWMLGLGIALVLLAGSLALRRPERAAQAASDSGDSPREMLKKPPFWLIFGWAVLIGAGGLAIIGNAGAFAEEMNLAAQTVLLTGLLTVCNGLGRLLFGALFDRAGRAWTMGAVSTALALAALVLVAAVSWGAVWMIYPGFVLFGLSYGGSPTCLSAFIRQTFGGKHYGTNYSIGVLNLIPAAFAPYLGAAVQSSTGSFLGAFWMLFGVGVAAAVLSLLLSRKKA